MNKTKIEWCDATWNPVTGCLHGCEYCYARKIANRFEGRENIELADLCPDDRNIVASCLNTHELNEPLKYKTKSGKLINAPYPFSFDPTFHRYRLGEPKKIKKSQNIFVSSMADLFGDWVPEEWIQEVFKACEAAPQHNYMFLTKNPQRYCKLANAEKLPELDNFWYGSTITKPGESMFAGSIHWNTFLSIEPLLEPLDVGIGSFGGAKWIIIGAETGNRAEKVKPERAWIKNIVEAARLTQAAVFMKDSLLPIMGEENMRREFPWEGEQNG
jgi:protein gp37